MRFSSSRVLPALCAYLPLTIARPFAPHADVSDELIKLRARYSVVPVDGGSAATQATVTLPGPTLVTISTTTVTDEDTVTETATAIATYLVVNPEPTSPCSSHGPVPPATPSASLPPPSTTGGPPSLSATGLTQQSHTSTGDVAVPAPTAGSSMQAFESTVVYTITSPTLTTPTATQQAYEPTLSSSQSILVVGSTLTTSIPTTSEFWNTSNPSQPSNSATATEDYQTMSTFATILSSQLAWGAASPTDQPASNSLSWSSLMTTPSISSNLEWRPTHTTSHTYDNGQWHTTYAHWDPAATQALEVPS